MFSLLRVYPRAYIHKFLGLTRALLTRSAPFLPPPPPACAGRLLLRRGFVILPREPPISRKNQDLLDSGVNNLQLSNSFGKHKDMHAKPIMPCLFWPSGLTFFARILQNESVVHWCPLVCKMQGRGMYSSIPCPKEVCSEMLLPSELISRVGF